MAGLGPDHESRGKPRSDHANKMKSFRIIAQNRPFGGYNDLYKAKNANIEIFWKSAGRA